MGEMEERFETLDYLAAANSPETELLAQITTDLTGLNSAYPFDQYTLTIF